MSDKDNITLLPTQQDKLLATGEELKRLLPGAIKNAEVVAQFKRAQFLAYVKEGFTEEQALALVK